MQGSGPDFIADWLALAQTLIHESVPCVTGTVNHRETASFCAFFTTHLSRASEREQTHRIEVKLQDGVVTREGAISSGNL